MASSRHSSSGTILAVSRDTSLDIARRNPGFDTQHYAFLVTEDEFDVIVERLMARGLPYWADPRHQHGGEINHWDDGRGLYFTDPNGHDLEILTRPYGSAGLAAANPHPLVTGSR